MKCHSGKDCNKDNNHKQMGLKGILKMSACCWGPMLGFLILSTLGIGASELLLLVCPLIMIYMIWMMGKMQQKEEKNSKAEAHTDTSLQEVESTPQTKKVPTKNRLRNLGFISFLLFVLFTTSIYAKASEQNPFSSDNVPTIKYSIIGPELRGAKGEFIIRVSVPKNHHAYLNKGDKGIFIPLNFNFSGVESVGYKISPISKPKGVYDNEVNARVLRGTGDFKFLIHRIKGREFIIPPIKARSQICNDITKICYFPNTDDIPIVIKEK